jgi:hypothetical protein
MSQCCDEYGQCTQGRDCPARTGTVLPHQAAHAQKVARIKSTRPAWLPGDGVPPEAGNFKIIDLGPDDVDAGQPLTRDESMGLVRTLLKALLVLLATVVVMSLLVSYGTEAFADVLWAYLAQLS